MESRAFGGSAGFSPLGLLPPAVQKRVEGLKGVQQEHAKVESELQLEILALEKKVGPFPWSSPFSDFVRGGEREVDSRTVLGIRVVRRSVRPYLRSTKGHRFRPGGAH